MEKTPSRTWRLNLIFGLLVLALMGLGIRMGLLLCDSRPKASRLAQTQEQLTLPLPGRIGSIFARANSTPVMLAGSKQLPSCYIDLKEDVLREDELSDVAIKLGQVLHLEALELNNLFHLRRGSRFVWVKRHVTPDEATAVKALKCRAAGILPEWQREYPNATLGSTLVGWRMGNGEPGGGMELSLSNLLLPKDGYKTLSTDACRRPTGEVETKAPEDGSNIFLTIDTNVQTWLEEAIATSLDKSKAKWGVGVMVNPKTGEILGMCSITLDPATRKPVSFDPEHFNATSADSRNNYAICVPFEPGSACKTPFATAAVSEGIVDWDTKIYCENGIFHSANGGTVSDHGSHYGWLTVREIIEQSSNVGMGKIGLKAGNDLIYKWERDFGFGSRTGIDLPGETGGIVRGRRQMDGYSFRVMFGQEISTSALQLAMAYCALANGGTLLKPWIVDRVVDCHGNVTQRGQRTVVRQACKPAAAQGAVEAMSGVVIRGTGKAAKLSKWAAFGKTGTAQIPSPIPGQHGYADGAFTGTFVGGAPASDPQVVCVISIHWPKVGSHYGAVVAAPYWKDVMEKTLVYLNVAPDKEDEPEAPRGGRAARGD